MNMSHYNEFYQKSGGETHSVRKLVEMKRIQSNFLTKTIEDNRQPKKKLQPETFFSGKFIDCNLLGFFATSVLQKRYDFLPSQSEDPFFLQFHDT